MPTPRKDEPKDKFIPRCVRYLIDNEGKEPDQAVAMCHSIWRDKDKKD